VNWSRFRNVPGVALFVGAALAGCGSTDKPAPIFERTPARSETAPVESRTSDTRNSKPSNPARTETSSKSAKTTTGDTQESKTKSGDQSAQIETRTDSVEAPQSKQPASKEPDSKTQSVAKPTTQSAPKPAARPTAQQISKPYRAGDWRPEYHTVQKGDTLFSIALDFGQDYRDLAKWNKLPDPSYIQIGQRLRLFPAGGSGDAYARTLPPAALPTVGKPLPVAKQIPTYSDPKAYRAIYTEKAYADLRREISGETETAVVQAKPATATVEKPSQAWKPPSASTPKSVQTGQAGLPDERLSWEWPAPGKVLYGFASGPNKKGVAIQGKPGQAIVSSAPGKVVYSGSGLRGYGRLIIIKHNETYLSVYAHNSQLLVSEGQLVAQGQKIAVMGGAKAGQTALHFEIRRLGQPIDPLSQLPARPS